MVKKEDINGNTPLKVIVQYLDQVVSDKYPRTKIRMYDHGRNIGKLELVDMLRTLVERE